MPINLNPFDVLIIDSVNEMNEADLFDVRVFYGGTIIRVVPAKVPRMIGKKGSRLYCLT